MQNDKVYYIHGQDFDSEGLLELALKASAAKVIEPRTVTLLQNRLNKGMELSDKIEAELSKALDNPEFGRELVESVERRARGNLSPEGEAAKRGMTLAMVRDNLPEAKHRPVQGELRNRVLEKAMELRIRGVFDLRDLTKIENRLNKGILLEQAHLLAIGEELAAPLKKAIGNRLRELSKAQSQRGIEQSTPGYNAVDRMMDLLGSGSEPRRKTDRINNAEFVTIPVFRGNRKVEVTPTELRARMAMKSLKGYMPSGTRINMLLNMIEKGDVEKIATLRAAYGDTLDSLFE